METTLLELGEPFVRAAARWPSLLAAVHERLEAQREDLAIQGVIAHLALAEHRLLLQLWHLAGRWGRVTAEGTVLPLPLTHELLGHVTAARRSTVTLAVSSLQAQGFVRQIDDRGWLLTPAAEHRVAAITRMRNTERVLGEMFRLRLRPVDLRDESRALMAQARQVQAQARTVGGH